MPFREKRLRSAQPGKSYEIKLRSTGDITIRPIEPKSPPATEAKSGK